MYRDMSFKVLSSQNKLNGTIVVALDEIHSVSDNVQDKAFDSILSKSIESKGMLNPILICTDSDFKETNIRDFERRPVPDTITEKYRCLIGNNRYRYAKENNYTHIECFLAHTYEEVKKAHLITQIEPRKML
jgi:hypothetical protein